MNLTFLAKFNSVHFRSDWKLGIQNFKLLKQEKNIPYKDFKCTFSLDNDKQIF